MAAAAVVVDKAETEVVAAEEEVEVAAVLAVQTSDPTEPVVAAEAQCAGAGRWQDVPTDSHRTPR